MRQRGKEVLHTITIPLPRSNPAMEPEGSSRIDTGALKLRVHHKDEVQ